MHILQVLAPTMMLIGFGAGLAWIRFLGRPFIGELNKLAYWVALPALIFRAAAHAGSPSLQTLMLVGAVAVPTVCAGVVSWIAARGLKMPDSSTNTFVATSFFGNLAVPLALLCIGGSLEMTSLRGHYAWIAASSVLKTAALPAIGWVHANVLGLGPADTRVVLIFCACPTAVVAYTMATQMKGDEQLAGGAIAVSTVISFLSLGVVLSIT